MLKVGATMNEKPKFTADQLVPATIAAKNFGKIRGKAKINPQFITDNSEVDTVVLAYSEYETMYIRLQELEDKEARMIAERIERLEESPNSALSWKDVRKSD